MLRSESYKKGIAYSTFFNFFAKSLGFLQSVGIAYYFGSQLQTDLYLYFYGIALLLAGFLNGLDQTVIIPEAIRIKTQDSVEKSMNLLSSVLFIYLALLIIILSVFFCFPVVFASTISKYDYHTIQQNSYLISGAISLTLLVTITTYLSNLLLAFRFFSIPVIISIINGLVALTFLIFLNKSLGTFSVVLGLVIGYTINILAVIALMKWKLKWRFTLSFWSFKTISFKKCLYAQLGNFSTLLCSYVPFYLLTGYAAGVVTHINYAMRTADIPNQIIISQVSAVLGIKFNEQISNENYHGFAEAYIKYSKLALSFLIPMSIFLSINSSTFIGFLYGRGHFTSQAIDETSLAFSILILNVPLFAMNSFVARMFIATQRLDISFLYQLAMNMGYIALIYTCMRLIGPMGYAFATVFIYFLSFLLVHFILKKIKQNIDYKLIVFHFAKTIFVSAGIGVIIYFILDHLRLSGIVSLLVSGLCFIIAFIPVAFAFKIIPALSRRPFAKEVSRSNQ